jgi:glycosyltransferase involved in cell wall biosynthesis
VQKVVTVCDAFPYVTPKTSTTLENLVFRLWLPIALHRADAVITISECSRNDIAHYLPVPKEKIFVIPISNSPAYRPLPAEAVQPVLAKLTIPMPYILYVGSLEPRKNLLRLLQAYAQLRQQDTRWHLVIVGARNFWKNAPVVETVEELALKPWVHFTGFVEEEDLPALYNGADLFAFPSLYEGFGLPPLEAMACGTPVVTSNSSSLPEVVGDAAIMVDPYDVDAIAGAMARVLNDPALAADLRQRGLARAGQFFLGEDGAGNDQSLSTCPQIVRRCTCLPPNCG